MTRRRELLKVLPMAGVTGAIWAKPVVDSVVLPSHAATTDTGGDLGGGTTIAPTTPAPVTYAIGDVGPGGGIVFQISNGGLNGLEAATSDQSAGVQWGCTGVDVSGATGTAIGTGESNTAAILAASCSGAAMAAAAEGPGWFLPSQDELDQLFLQRAVVGGFTSGVYWSSSQYSGGLARQQDFINGLQDILDKFIALRVRAVRAF